MKRKPRLLFPQRVINSRFESGQTGFGLPASGSCWKLLCRPDDIVSGGPGFTCACTVAWGEPRAASATDSSPYAGHGWWRSPPGGSWCRSSGQSSSYSLGSWSRTRSPSVKQETGRDTHMMQVSVYKLLYFMFWLDPFSLNHFPLVEQQVSTVVTCIDMIWWNLLGIRSINHKLGTAAPCVPEFYSAVVHLRHCWQLHNIRQTCFNKAECYKSKRSHSMRRDEPRSTVNNQLPAETRRTVTTAVTWSQVCSAANSITAPVDGR